MGRFFTFLKELCFFWGYIVKMGLELRYWCFSRIFFFVRGLRDRVIFVRRFWGSGGIVFWVCVLFLGEEGRGGLGE